MFRTIFLVALLFLYITVPCIANEPMPTISGTPDIGVTVGDVYSFTPTTADATSFSITNKPSWASFDSATATLSGMPKYDDAGIYANIVINATNNAGTVSLTSFTVTVSLISISPTAWQQIDMPSYINALVIDPTNSQTIYAATYRGGVFKSINGGSIWCAINDGLTSTNIRSLAMDPTNNQTLYAGTGDNKGVLKTTNGGISWSAVNNGLPMWNYDIVVIDPANSQTIYAGASSGNVYKSTDSGNSWANISSGLTSWPINSLVIDPSNTQIIYAGTSYGGVYKSINGGGSWSAYNIGLPASTQALSLAIDPKNSQVIYVATMTIATNAVYKSIDGGISWISASSGINSYNNLISSLTIDANDKQSIYASTASGVFKSTIGSNSWTNLNSGSGMQVMCLAIDPTNSQKIFIGTFGKGIIKFPDIGGRWTPVNTGLSILNTSIDTLALSYSEITYAGTASGVFKSMNGFYSLEATNVGLANMSVKSIVNDTKSSEIVYAGTSSGVFKTTDSGVTWNIVNSGLTNTSVTTIVIDTTNSQTIYAGTNGGGVYKSTNGGTSWSAVNIGLANKYISTLAITKTGTNIIYAITLGGIYKSINGDNSWSFVSDLTSTQVNSMVIDSTNDQTIYIGKTEGVFKSTNGGISWLAMSSGIPEYSITSLAIDDVNSQTIYAGTNGGGVYKSTNGGTSWSAVNSGLANKQVNALVVHSFPGELAIYAGTSCGLFRGLSHLISGIPSISVTSDSIYRFIPTAYYPISFSLINKPSWISFDTTTGALTGSPADSDIGTYNNIIITVNSSRGTEALPAFSITVLLPMPTISGIPSTNLTEGDSYSFVPTATTTTSFSIFNKPNWASFDTNTGALTGTPTNANSSFNIIIGATNSTGTVYLPAFNITVNPKYKLLSVSVTGTGGGTVTSLPSGIICTKDSSTFCSNMFIENSTVTLYSFPDINSTFGEWQNIGCQTSGACSFNMESNKSINSIFIAAPNAKIGAKEYLTLKTAFADAINDSTIFARKLLFLENLVFDVGSNVMLTGGYDSSFSNNTDTFSTIKGSLKIRNGRLKVDHILIQ